jgi:hypothetical protein
VLLPFYDHYLKGASTDYLARPNVEYAVRGSNAMRSSDTWPLANVRYVACYLTQLTSQSVTSLNDGGLSRAPGATGATSYSYPIPGWVAGVVGFGPSGPAGGFDPVRRVLTFTGEPLAQDLEIAGPIKLTLFLSSTAAETDVFAKLSDQYPQANEDRAKGLNPLAEVVTRGWLRASHREIDAAHSTDMVPRYTHRNPEPLTRGVIYKLEISLEPMAYLFRKGHRIRLELVNGDSPVTEALWPHYYRPDKIGTDTIHHGADYPSALILPVADSA